MQSKHLLTFVAVAILVGAVVSMTTSGVFAAQTKSANNTNTEADSPAQSDFVKQGMTDADEQGGAKDSGTDDTSGEQEDSQDCQDCQDCQESDVSGDNAISETAAVSENENSTDNADEQGDNNDVNDTEDKDMGNEDAGQADTEKNGTASTSANGNATGADDNQEENDQAAFDPCNFSNKIDNPYMPLSKYTGKTLTFEGTSTENGSSTKVQELWNVQSKTVDIAGIETLVVVVQEYKDGQLAQEALQYYAQGKDGVVYQFGEDIADYENGKAVENDVESWTVGDDTATPGIVMPANPATGMGFAYSGIDVPGIAHEVSEVKSLNESLSVGYGSFNSTVLQVNAYDFNKGETSKEFYAPEIGLVKEADDDEEFELVSIQTDKDYNPIINPSDFVSNVDNPYHTLSSGDTYTYETKTDEGTEKNIVKVTTETKNILGIPTTVVWDRVWLDGELIEETFDWYAQDKEGNVWYIGEDSKEYEDGKVVSTEGSWEAGVDGAKPGIIMEAHPKASDSYRQEYYKGHAEDRADVISLNEKVTVPFGTFTNCLQTRDWSTLDPTLNEYKYYCTDVGGVALEVVVEGGERTELTSVQ